MIKSVQPLGNKASTRRRASAIVWLVLALGCATAWAAAAMAMDSGNADGLDASHRREAAAHELKKARQATLEARNAERAARRELDNFVAQHFEEYRFRDDAAGATREPSSVTTSTAKSERVELDRQLQELLKQRDQLLGRLTPVHPEVVDVNDRIGLISQQLSALDNAGNGAPALPAGKLAPGQPSRTELERVQHQSVAAQYEKVFARWQSAERKLRMAVAAEDVSAERLAMLESPDEPRLQPLQSLPQSTVVYDGPQHNSQPLALAALLIALAVAALAAVRLARSDSVFANVDEVAAALALPVVGVIPASAAPVFVTQSKATRRMVRGVIMTSEIVLAFLAFTLVAYGLQNPAAIWQVVSDPIDALRRMGGIFGGE